MILFTVFNPDTGAVLSHKMVSDAEMVAYGLPEGTHALVGRHVPFGDMVRDGVEFIIPSNPDLAPVLPALDDVAVLVERDVS